MLLPVEKNSVSTENKIKKSKLYILPLGIIFFIFIVVSIISYLALKNNGYKDIQYSINNDLIRKTTYSILNDEDIILEQNEFNTILNGLILKNSETPKFIKNVSIIPQKNEECLVFIPIEYKGINLEVSLKTNVQLNRDRKLFEFKILEAKIGNLPIPKNILLSNINNDFVRYEDDILFIKSGIDLEVFNKKITCNVDKFYLKDGRFYLKFKINNDILKIF